MLNGSLPVKSDDGHRMIPGIDRNRAAGASWRAAKAKNKVRNCLCGNISIKSTDSTYNICLCFRQSRAAVEHKLSLSQNTPIS